MAISDAQYQEWLSLDGAARTVLIEAQAKSGSSVVTRYMSNRPYISSPSASPANTPYHDIVVAVPAYRSTMSEAFTGSTKPSWGLIEIYNSGELDSWLDDAWDGRPLNIYLGDASWDRADFRLILPAITDDITAPSRDKLAFSIRDKQQLLNAQLQSAAIGGTNAAANNVTPVGFGEVYNISPVLIDSATNKYQIHDGQIEAITTVYANGLSVAFTASLSTGTFTLNAAPTGQITCDAKLSKTAGTYLTKAGDIVNRIVKDYGGFVSGDVDSTSLSAFNTLCPQTVGVYCQQRVNMIPVIDELVTSVGGWWGIGRDAKLKFGRLDAPASPVLSLTQDDVVEGGLKVLRRIRPALTVRIGYKKNYTVQTSGFASTVTAARQGEIAAANQVVSVANAGIDSTYLRATEADVANTLMVSSSDASTEATRRATLANTLRFVYQVECYATPQKLEVGMVVNLTHARFGFSSGRNCVIVGITEKPTSNRITLELWR